LAAFLISGKICVFACFPAGTLVNTEHGQIPIEQIRTGDKVWAFDEYAGIIDLKEVLRIA
jgi:Hint domain